MQRVELQGGAQPSQNQQNPKFGSRPRKSIFLMLQWMIKETDEVLVKSSVLSSLFLIGCPGWCLLSACFITATEYNPAIYLVIYIFTVSTGLPLLWVWLHVEWHSGSSPVALHDSLINSNKAADMALLLLLLSSFRVSDGFLISSRATSRNKSHAELFFLPLTGFLFSTILCWDQWK